MLTGVVLCVGRATAAVQLRSRREGGRESARSRREAQVGGSRVWRFRGGGIVGRGQEGKGARESGSGARSRWGWRV